MMQHDDVALAWPSPPCNFSITCYIRKSKGLSNHVASLVNVYDVTSQANCLGGSICVLKKEKEHAW